MKSKYLLIACLMVAVLRAQPADSSFQTVIKDFEREYSQLDLPGLGLSYVSNLENISSFEELERQELFFKKYQKLLHNCSAHRLSEEDQLSHAVLLYEIDLNLERIDLEYKWLKGGYAIEGTRVFDEQSGKQWYAYFLKKWVDRELAPDAAYQFGLKEIEEVKRRMAEIPARMGMDKAAFKRHLEDSTYFLTSNDKILEQYNGLRKHIRETAKQYFPDVDKVAPVSIAIGADERMAIAPAYYSNNTFYYNFFGDSYDSRDMGWIFLHEAIPGHHYQGGIAATLDSSVRDMFWYAGYVEGWGAYIEQFGNELGAYASPMDAYGQLEWDLVRSVRVALDVALNYYGWTDERALEFWNQHIPDKEDIARREIKRMKRWPAQVITYKYGKRILDELKGDRNTPEALKAFHRQVLECGVVPVSVLRSHIQKKSPQKPSVFEFGSTMAQMKEHLESHSDSMEVRTNEPIQLPTAQNSQSQLDVYGFLYAGKKRKAELIFADDALDIVWILTDAEEEASFLEQFREKYGDHTHITEDATFFLDHGVAVRNQPHEILFISERLKAPYRQFLKK